MILSKKKSPKGNWGWMGICLLFALSACTTDLKIQDEQYDGRYLNLTFQKTKTKTDLDSDGSGNFSEGDKIGLFIDNGSETQYKELTFSNGKWEPMLRRSDFGTGNLILSAHYPAISDGASTVYELQINSDQSQSGENKSDILFAKDTIAEGQYEAYFPFEHIMHRLNIKTSGATENVSIFVRSKCNGNINLLTGESSTKDNSFQWITPYKNTDGSLQTIIFPQAASPYRTDKGLIKITANGKDTYYMAPDKLDNGATLSEFEKGKETTINLTLKTNEENEWANKKVWVYGINEPEESQWVQLYPTTHTTYYLPWKKEYNWFDVNKRNPTDRPEGIPDGQLCWAASASNLLHWWISHNKTYIDKFGDKYKGPDYGYPLDKAQESDIFQLFIDSFFNKAGRLDDGINWFIHGTIPTAPSLRYPENYAGYFKEVFPQGVELSKNYGGLGKEIFNDILKDAFKNNKALGAAFGPVTSTHVMTIWGAEFDEEGFCNYIYVADNNDRDRFDDYGVGIMRYGVTYVTFEGSTATQTHYKTNYIENPDASFPINRLVTLELGTEYWKKYFNE